MLAPQSTSPVMRPSRGRRVLGLSACAAVACVLAACDKLERESFGEGSDGVRAVTRRNARTLAALLEFTDLRVVDVGKLLDVNRDAAWNLRRKWIDLDEEQRQSWLKVVFARLK